MIPQFLKERMTPNGCNPFSQINQPFRVHCSWFEECNRSRRWRKLAFSRWRRLTLIVRGLMM